MKKKLLSILAFILCFSFASKAQLTPGKILVGGNLSFSKTSIDYENSGTSKSTGYNISPSFGKVYRRNRVAGVSLNYAHGTGTNSINGYGAGVFLRQYKPFGNIFYVFAHEGLNYNYTKLKSNNAYDVQTNKTNAVNLGLNPGLACDINPHLQLELLLNSIVNINYSSNESSHSIDVSQNNTTRQFNIGSNFDISNPLGYINVGVRFLIGK